MTQENHLKAILKKYVLRTDLKTLKDSACLISEGREFQSVGAQDENARSPIDRIYVSLKKQNQRNVDHDLEYKQITVGTNNVVPNHAKPYRLAWEFLNQSEIWQGANAMTLKLEKYARLSWSLSEF